MNPFDKILIKSPKFSRFDKKNTNKLSMDFGKLVPIYWDDCTPSQQKQLKLSALVKTAPMLAPVFDRYKLECFAFFVPYRILGWNSEDFFNLTTPIADRPAMPQGVGYFGDASPFSAQNPMYDALTAESELPDYLGLPVYTHLKNILWNMIVNGGYMRYDGNKASYVEYTNPAAIYNNWLYLDDGLSFDYDSDTNYIGNLDYLDADHKVIYTFLGWWFSQINQTFDYTDPATADDAPSPVDLFGDTLSTIDGAIEYLANNTQYKSVESAMAAYRKYAISEAMRIGLESSNVGDGNMPTFEDLLDNTSLGKAMRDSLMRSTLTKRVYHRIIADWFINTNIQDYDTYLNNYVYNDYSESAVPGGWTLADRYWENDYFTSAFASQQNGSQVAIPVNGTIRDLRNASALQKVMELVLYSGRRYIDQIRTFFGAKSSDARLDRAEVLGKCDFIFGIDEISQTSQTNSQSALGSYAGRGITSGADGMFNYYCEEHGMIMILANIKPLATYMEYQNRFYFKTSPYDFLLSHFSNVGEQPIWVDEVSNRIPSSSNGGARVTFGWQRRFGEYMFKANEVHGAFCSSLDYWTSARVFDGTPSLNENFLKVGVNDNIDRIFADPSASDHFYCYFAFETRDVLPLSRFLNYDL